MTKPKQQSIIAPLLKNNFALSMMSGKIPQGASFLLITSDMVSDLTLSGYTQDLLLAELKDLLSVWSWGTNPVNDRHLHVRSVYLVRNKSVYAFQIDKNYALGEFNLLAEDLFLLFENKQYESKKF